MAKFIKNLNIEKEIDKQYRLMSHELTEFRKKQYNFDDNSLIVDEKLRKNQMNLKAYFDVKLLVKNKALQDQDYELFEMIPTMSEEEAQVVLEDLFKKDEQFRIEILRDFDKNYISESS